MSGKTYHVGVTNVEVEDLTPRSSTLLVRIPSSVPARAFNSCPIDKELDFKPTELASWVLVFCINRLLYRALSSIPSGVYSWDPQGSSGGMLRSLLLWVCQAVGDLPERLCSMSGKTCHVWVTNVEEEDLIPSC
jgi:hypothetical protein